MKFSGTDGACTRRPECQVSAFAPGLLPRVIDLCGKPLSASSRTASQIETTRIDSPHPQDRARSEPSYTSSEHYFLHLLCLYRPAPTDISLLTFASQIWRTQRRRPLHQSTWSPVVLPDCVKHSHVILSTQSKSVCSCPRVRGCQV